MHDEKMVVVGSNLIGKEVKEKQIRSSIQQENGAGITFQKENGAGVLRTKAREDTMSVQAKLVDFQQKGSKEMEAAPPGNRDELKADTEKLEKIVHDLIPSFSTNQMATSLCKANRNSDLLVEFPHQPEDSSISRAPEIEKFDTGTSSSSQLLPESISDESILEEEVKPMKFKTRPISSGTVSSVIGKYYGKTSAKKPAAETFKRLTSKELEDILFQMLGSRYEINMNIVRDALELCGLDPEKSMEVIMNVSASAMQNRDILLDHLHKVEEPEQKPEKANLPQSQEDERYNLQKEVLASLFGVPKRDEDVPRRFHARAVKPRLGRRVILVPPDSDVEEEDDTYEALRRSTKEHWLTMKEYYRAALEAFTSGDHVQAERLLKQGLYHRVKAREADKKTSDLLILERRKKINGGKPVELQRYKLQMILPALKMFLFCRCGGIPGQRVKVIIFDSTTTESEKDDRRDKVVSMLANSSIIWTEESEGTILVELDGVSPEKLRMYESSDDE